MYKKILLAVDGSDVSNRAIEKVIKLQKEWNSEVVVFHSVMHHMIMPVAYSSGYALQMYMNVEEDERQEGRKIIDQAKIKFHEADAPAKFDLITYENPEEYIERIVEVEKFDLVVLGVKGTHSKLKQAITGSITKKVIKKAPCDVLVVK
jgi:nucleotide-binding universal stress UspA family protein